MNKKMHQRKLMIQRYYCAHYFESVCLLIMIRDTENVLEIMFLRLNCVFIVY